MPKNRLWILLVILTSMMVFVTGCGKEQLKPPPASEPQAIDYPNDAGEKVIIKWNHYLVSTAAKYQVFRGTSKDAIDTQVAEITTKESPSVTDTSSLNIFDDANYYLVLDNSVNPPSASIVEATAENEDSIKQVGEKIKKVEVGFVDSEKCALETVLIKGSFYNVAPSAELLNEPVFKTIDNAAISEDGDSIIEGEKALTLKMKLNDRERSFIEKGRRLMTLNGSDNDLIKKYGKSVFAVITDTKRYSNAVSEMSAVDNNADGVVKPGINLYYRIVAVNDMDATSHTDVIEITPVDDAPMVPSNVTARYDSLKKSVLFTWSVSGSDLVSVNIMKSTVSDTLMENGIEIASVNPSWSEFKIDNFNLEEDVAFYLVVNDASTYSKSNLVTPVAAEFCEISIPENIRIEDHKNDEALALDIFWGQPELMLSYRVIDLNQQKKEIDFTKKTFYVDNEIVIFEDDSLVPEEAQIVESYFVLEASEKLDLAVMYSMNANLEDKAGFAEITIEGMGINKTIKDIDGVGRILFNDLEHGEYKISAEMVNKNGRSYDNPESKAEVTAIVDFAKYVEETGDSHYYKIFRLKNEEGVDTSPHNFEHFSSRSAESHQFIDRWTKDEEGTYREETTYEYSYFLRTVGPDGSYVDSEILGPIAPQNNWFNTQLTLILIFMLLLFVTSGYYLVHAKKGTKFYIRPIAGIVHIDEALGRATEMGKPIMYVMGIGLISDLPTLASMTILERVARKAAEYQNRLIVPAYDPIVMLVAQETVRSAYLDAGRPDAYNEKDIFYVSSSQFSYAAAVSGIMVREKTATNFFLGWFAAESLILSETGASTGAIQIAGTDAVAQLPFFITSCDYTLIGEELYAASAYMSQDPQQLASLKIQDFIKAVNMSLILLGTVAYTSGVLWFVNLFKVTIEK